LIFFFTGKIILELNKRIMKCLVWSVAALSRDIDNDPDRQKKIRGL